MCNIVSWHHVSQIQPPQSEDDPDIEEQIELLAEKIGQIKSAESRAQELMRERLILMGIDPDAKPEISPELQAKMDADAERMMGDEELYFGGHTDKEIRGKKIKDSGDW